MDKSQAMDRMQEKIEATTDHLAPDVGLRFRPMFGGRGVYAHDRMFASISSVGFAVKLSEEMQAEALKLPLAKRLQYGEDQPVSKDKIVLPAFVLKDPELLAKWVQRSIEFTLAQPVKKPRPPKVRR